MVTENENKNNTIGNAGYDQKDDLKSSPEDNSKVNLKVNLENKSKNNQDNNSPDVPKNYDPKVSEPKWREFWEKEGVFKFEPESKSEVFSVDTPPPTVSGKMHIGHAFSFTQQDIIVRYKRMKGYNIFCPFGTDDNGLATERLIEKMKGVKATKMDREEFVKLCLDTLENELRPKYVQDWKDIGMSCDWDIFYTTISPYSKKISQKAFLDLVKKKRVQRKYSPIMICPHCNTAIAQVEMEDKEEKSTLNYIKTKVVSGDFKGDNVIYATTRPELLPACMGISIHKGGEYARVETMLEGFKNEIWIISLDAYETFKDEWKLTLKEKIAGTSLEGTTVSFPITDAKIKISHDDESKTKYGTGIVYYCSYGGTECVEWLARHKDAKPILVMGVSGKYNQKAGKYQGMDSIEARKEILEDLTKVNALIKKEDIKHVVNVHERCGTPIEFVAAEQWFIPYLDLKDAFLERANELNWFPKHMKNRYDNWVKGLKWDWCISRQRFSGVPFPVWYNKESKEPIFADEDQLPVDPLKDLPKGYTADQVIPEKDVMDTWATSSLTPHLAVDRYKGTEIYDKIYPMSLRPQAHDIITFWLFNTVVRSHIHDNTIPWKDVMISGWALDPHGKKMSKSKGNVVEPQKMIEKYSADALRFWTSGSSLGEDLPFQEKDLVTGKKLIKKLWNASKFAMMHLKDFENNESIDVSDLETIDRYMLTKLQNLISGSTSAMEGYQYSRMRLDIEKFFWQDFCDNYLEICKDRLYNPDKRGDRARLSAQYTLYNVLLSLLKMFAPIMPFITEEIYSVFFSAREGYKSIHISLWPENDDKLVDEATIGAGKLFVSVLQYVRKAKSEASKGLTHPVDELFVESKLDEEVFLSMEDDLKATTKANKIYYKQLEGSSEEDLVCDIKME